MNSEPKEFNWSVKQRLAYIEQCAWWKGVVNRGDLVERFEVTLAQSSQDMTRYVEMNPEAMSYNLRLKRYEATAGMKCVRITPNLEEAAWLFLGGGERVRMASSLLAGDCESEVIMTQVPARPVDPTVARRAFLAIMNGHRIHARTLNPEEGRMEWHWLRPHALGHTGAWWFVRAWCETYDIFQDYPIHRIENIEWSRQQAPSIEKDLEWEEWTSLLLRAKPTLDRASRKVVEYDYGMTGGKVAIPVRKAMLKYLKQQVAADDRVYGNPTVI